MIFDIIIFSIPCMLIFKVAYETFNNVRIIRANRKQAKKIDAIGKLFMLLEQLRIKKTLAERLRNRAFKRRLPPHK